MAPEYFNGAGGVGPPADVPAIGAGRSGSLEKRPTEQFKQAQSTALESCFTGAVFRRFNGRDYDIFPFRCGAWSCATCGPGRSARARRGIRRAVGDLGLADLLTLTLPGHKGRKHRSSCTDPGHGGPCRSPPDPCSRTETARTGPSAAEADSAGSSAPRFLTAVESRTAISRLWNALCTRLRTTVLCASSRCRRTWRLTSRRQACPSCGNPVFLRFLVDYVAVDEDHEDGTAHKHVALRLDGLRAWLNDNGAAVEAYLAEAWGRLGGGFVDYRKGRPSLGGARSAAGYLTKYIAKAMASPPAWAELRWCTEDGAFRSRPWHRFSASRRASMVIAGPQRPPGGPHSWRLMLQVQRPSGRMAFEPWNPASGSAIMPECDGHPVAPDWAPGSCHHGERDQWPCFCVPPWAAELPWEPSLAARLDSWDPDEFLCEPWCACDLHRPRALREDRPRFDRFGPRFGPSTWAG